MKVRMGFVSNSSSSSFVIALKPEEVPSGPCETSELLFGDKNYACDIGWHDTPVSSYHVASKFFNDLQGSFPIDISVLTELIRYSWETYEKAEEQIGKKPKDMEDETYRKKLKKKIEEVTRQLVKEFVIREDVENKLLFHLEYSDDTPLGEVMEHGNVFRNLPHKQISHH